MTQQKPKDTQAHSMSNDLWGKALLEYFEGTSDGIIETETTHSEPEPFSMAYLFRNLEQLPKVEQVALQLAQGSI
jgi:3-methyladenine DNA glycosylase Mpg